jgi:hypothetical protein
MRQLRWKKQYVQGDRELDQRHKRFLGCFNQLLNAAGQREHCQELDQFLTRMGTDLDVYLRTKDATEIAPAQDSSEFLAHIVQDLPLQPYGSTACRECGLCDLAQAKIAEHLQAPLDCLQHHQTKN